MAEEPPVVVVSPHMDDGVFSCGALLAARPGSTVVTVFAGVPPHGYEKLTAWNRACGFKAGEDVVRARYAEDIAACGALYARATHLPFLESQYLNGAKGTHQRTHPFNDAAIAAMLAGKLGEVAPPPTPVFFPLGLVHSDHRRVHAAALRLHGALRGRVYYYAEAIYRAMPGALDKRLAALSRRGLHAVACECRSRGAEEDAKSRAVNYYGTQLVGLRKALKNFTNGDAENLTDIFRPETFYVLHGAGGA